MEISIGLRMRRSTVPTWAPEHSRQNNATFLFVAIGLGKGHQPRIETNALPSGAQILKDMFIVKPQYNKQVFNFP